MADAHKQTHFSLDEHLMLVQDRLLLYSFLIKPEAHNNREYLNCICCTELPSPRGVGVILRECKVSFTLCINIKRLIYGFTLRQRHIFHLAGDLIF